MSREIWDFDEKKNYILKHGYKVIKRASSDHAALLLKNSDTLIKFTLLKLPKNKYTKLLMTTPYKLQEMQLEKDQGLYIFNGLNKPKSVRLTDLPKIGEDGSLRAKRRVIFLNLRKSSGKLKNIKELIPLLAHELAHTMMNHVTWRKDDHDKNFKQQEKLIKEHLMLSYHLVLSYLSKRR